MSKLVRYIGRSVLVSILAVLGVILGLALLFAYIDQLGDFDDNYGALQALTYVLLAGPRRAYELLPMAALIGCLIGLGSLASSSELIIMRAAGVSLARIVWAVMKPMLLIMLAGVLIGEYVAPWSAVMPRVPSMACGIVRDVSTFISMRCSPTVFCLVLHVISLMSSAICCRQVLPSVPSTEATIGSCKRSPRPTSVIVTPRS